MTPQEEEIFVKQAFQSLIDRGIVKPDYFVPSTVSDADLAAFEGKYNIVLPSLLKTFLKTSCYDFNYIRTPVPTDIDPETIQCDEFEMHLLWLDILSIPKENPLLDLYNRMDGFREVATEVIGMPLESIAHLLPVGDWYAGAGPLCIDLTIPKKAIDIDDMDTWSLQFFDHEEFDWNELYLQENGLVKGDSVAPDFKTLLEWYFCGKFDKAYEEDEDEKPDYSEYIR